MADILLVFFNVIAPVFCVVLISYLVGNRLGLQAQTLNRAAYYVFVPAFVFQAVGGSRIQIDKIFEMMVFIVFAHLLAALVAVVIGRLLGRSREAIAAFVIVAVSGNVGNFGLALIHFRLGDASVGTATLYYVILSTTSFIVSVGAAGWARGGSRGAFLGLLKTPAIWALVPALLVSVTGQVAPVPISRMIGILADAMIPVSIFSLGLQLREQRQFHFSCDVIIASLLRLLVTPALACLVAIPFKLGHIEYTAGVLQAGMPTANMAAIIAKETDILPNFVMSVILCSVLLSLITLPILMVML